MWNISCLYEKGNGTIHLVLKLSEVDPQFFKIFLKIREIKRTIELCQIVIVTNSTVHKTLNGVKLCI